MSLKSSGHFVKLAGELKIFVKSQAAGKRQNTADRDGRRSSGEQKKSRDQKE